MTLSKKFERVLRILDDRTRPMYGLELVEASDGDLTEWTVYVHLARMVKRGLIDAADENPPPARGIPRKVYRITPRGQQALADQNG